MNAPLVESPSSPIRYAPDGDDGPVYLLKVPRRIDQTEYRRDLIAAGCQYPSDLDMLGTLIRAIGRLMTLPEDAEQRDMIIAEIEAYRDGVRLWVDGKGERPVPSDIVDGAWHAGMADGQFAGKMADRVTYAERASVVATRRFLIGWEGPEVEFRRTSAGVPDDLLELMPQEHIMGIGEEISQRLVLQESRRKNFGLRSGGEPDQQISSTTKTQPKNLH